MSIISNIFGVILKFNMQTEKWCESDDNDADLIMDIISHSSQSFRKYTHFLFNILTKLVGKGYQKHFEDLLLRLNFNEFFSKQ